MSTKKRISKTQIDALRTSFMNAPPKEQTEFTSAETVRLLSEEIVAMMRDKDYSLLDVAAMMREKGVDLSVATIRTYLRDAASANGKVGSKAGRAVAARKTASVTPVRTLPTSASSRTMTAPTTASTGDRDDGEGR